MMVAALLVLSAKGIVGIWGIKVVLAFSINRGGDAMAVIRNAGISVEFVGAVFTHHAETILPYGPSPLTSP